MLKIKSDKSYRSLSQIFTPNNFKKVISTDNNNIIDFKIKNNIENFHSKTYGDILDFTYKKLIKNYRSEYIFKNEILKSEVLKSHFLRCNTLLNEFKVAKSIADIVILNGEIKIFEIKTDLDGLEKLQKQISDYQKFANKVSIIVTSKNLYKLLEIYHESPIGIIEFTNNNKLKTIKEALNYTDNFDYSVIFKTLRKNEYLKVIEDYFGYIPDVPNTQIFKKCLEKVKEINLIEFQSIVCMKLKQRKIKLPETLTSSLIPNELKHICYTSNFSEKEYDKLFEFLNTKI